MATTCPIGFDRGKLRAEVRDVYARVATNPDGEFHFHRGAAYAREFLHYDSDALAQLPDLATASFAGVANPHRIAPIARGETVVDIGCGAGMDLMLAALAVGSDGTAIGVDMTAAMRERASRVATELGLTHVDVRDGDAEALPVGSASVDVVISNGVLNLTTDKIKAFSEILRILKPGGRLQLADIVVAKELSLGVRLDVDLWSG